MCRMRKSCFAAAVNNNPIHAEANLAKKKKYCVDDYYDGCPYPKEHNFNNMSEVEEVQSYTEETITIWTKQI